MTPLSFLFDVASAKTSMDTPDYKAAIDNGLQWYETSWLKSVIDKPVFWFIPLLLSLLFPFVKRAFDEFLEDIQPEPEAVTSIEVVRLLLETMERERKADANSSLLNEFRQ